MGLWRLNSSGNWGQVKKIYRLSSVGNWVALKNTWRLSSSGIWQSIFSSEDAPVKIVSPTLLNQSSSASNFYGGDTITLTRGSYTNTTTDSNTTYVMKIYKGLDKNLPLNDSNWEPQSTTTFTGANSTASTSITYSLSDQDAKLGYYLIGQIAVNNNANTPASTIYYFDTIDKVLSRISFTVSGLTVTPSSTGGTFSWTVGGVDGSSFIYDQILTIRITGPSGEIKKTVSIAAGTTTVTVSDNVNILPSTGYYAEIAVTANDEWKFTATPNKLTDNVYFNTKATSPINTSLPTILTVNNRGYIPVSTVLSADKGSWSNVSLSTIYEYRWTREDVVTGVPEITGYSTSNTNSYTLDHLGDSVFVTVRATNTDSDPASASSQQYILDQAVAVGAISPTSITRGISTNFSFNISHYPTNYTIDWGDGTPLYNSGDITANTSTVNASVAKIYSTSGTYTILVTANPGGKTSTATLTVADPAPNSFTYTLSNTGIVTTPSQPTQTRVSSTSNIVLVEWASTKPLDTESYNLNVYGAGSSTGGTLASPAVQNITTLNQYNSSGSTSSGAPYTFDAITGISSSASTSPISTYVTSIGTTRSLTANIDTTTGAQSWAINFSWSGASTSTNVTYYSNGVANTSSLANSTQTVYTNSWPVKIIDITGTNNPTITINSITAYSRTNQTGTERAGTAGTTTSIPSVAKPTANSTTSTNNYTYYQPGAFTYSISQGVISTPSQPVQTRVASTSNIILLEWASSKPSDVADYTLFVYGAGSATGGTLASPSQSIITNLNQYNSSGSTSSGAPYTFDAITGISSSANNSPLSTYVRANGNTRTFSASVSSTIDASSWAVNYTVSGASSGNGTFTLNTNSMPVSFFSDTGANNPTVTINSVTAYTDTNQTGVSRAGSAGSPTSIASASKPTATSTTSTSNYTAYVPVASGFAATDITSTPSQASSITVTGNTSNIATVSWANGSPITSVNVTTSGAGSSINFTDSSSPFDTSTTGSYTSSATITATVTTTNNNKNARISWNQSNTKSYRVDYTISGLGNYFLNADSSAASVSVDVNLGSTSRTVTFTSLTVYTELTQTGISTSYTSINQSVTPTDKTSTATGSGAVTYTPPTLTTPTISTPGRTAGGFQAQVTNYNTNQTYSATRTSYDGTGTPTFTWGVVSGLNYPFEVTNMSDGSSATYTITTSRTGYTDASASVTGSSLNAALNPIFDTPVRTSNGFTVNITNYDSNYTWNITTNSGTLTLGTISGSTYPLTITGLTAGSSATITATTTRSTYRGGSNTVAGQALQSARTPTFGTNTSTSTGFTGSVNNYDSNWTWSFSINLGTVTPGTPSGTSYPFTVTGLTAGQSATVTVISTRSGYLDGSATTTASAAFVTPTPSSPLNFLGSRNLNGAVGTSRRNWFWNVATGMGSYSYVIYTLEWYNQTTNPGATPGVPTALMTYGTSLTTAPVTNANNFNYSGTSTPAYRTMARGSTYAGDNGTSITAATGTTWARAICRVTATNGTTYAGAYTSFVSVV